MAIRDLKSGGTQAALLADSLELLRLQSWFLGRLDLKTPWGLRLGDQFGWFHLPGRRCLVELQSGEVAHCSAGDLIVVFPGNEHCIRDDSAEPSQLPHQDQARPRLEGVETFLGAPATLPDSLLCGSFAFEGLDRMPLHGCLPGLIHLKGDGQRPPVYVEQLLRLMAQEAHSEQPCAPLVINRLVRILLIKALQEHTASKPGAGNWLHATADPDIGRAIALMHDQPEAPWTVAALADRVAMSRSAFSARFTSLVGKPPLEYLSEWRMQKASHLLRNSHEELKEIAARVGYDSASAFSKAFARWTGMAPGAYRAYATAKGSLTSPSF